MNQTFKTILPATKLQKIVAYAPSRATLLPTIIPIHQQSRHLHHCYDPVGEKCTTWFCLLDFSIFSIFIVLEIDKQ